MYVCDYDMEYPYQAVHPLNPNRNVILKTQAPKLVRYYTSSSLYSYQYTNRGRWKSHEVKT